MKAKTIKLNENLDYTNIFGKTISHNEALQKRIRDQITTIIAEENNISEKAFSAYDDIMNKVQFICDKNPEIYEKAEEFYKNGRRLSLLAEEMFEKYFKK